MTEAYKPFAAEEPLIRHPAVPRSGLLLLALALGALAVFPSVLAIVTVWRFDALRSVGALFPLVAFALFVRAWHRLGWERDGTPWGLLPIAVAATLARVFGSLALVYHFGRGNSAINLLQPGLLFFLVASGVLLCLGGVRLWRASLFPLCLLLLVNPVPSAFNKLVDLPLQQISAATARHFAEALGLRPGGQDLSLLFTPSFGMTIVPGCNGSRGALTLGYLALVLGYLCSFPARRIALSVVGAVLLGYLLNFVRLCLLVLYYAAARHVTAWQGYGELVDYCIGSAVFATAAAVFATFFRGRGAEIHPRHASAFAPLRLRALLPVCVLLVICAVTQMAWSWPALRTQPRYYAVDAAMDALPRTVGPYKRTRTWTEQDKAGGTSWAWGQYADARGGDDAVFGLWLAPVTHFGIDSERAHGRAAVWTGSLNVTDRSNKTAQLLTYETTDAIGMAPSFSAETTCTPTGCSDAGAGFGQSGFAWAAVPVTQQRRLSMLVRVPNLSDRARGEAVARTFYGALDLQTILDAVGR